MDSTPTEYLLLQLKSAIDPSVRPAPSIEISDYKPES
jgi:hypothetical protein